MHLVIEESTFGASKYSFIDRFFPVVSLFKVLFPLSEVLLYCYSVSSTASRPMLLLGCVGAGTN